MCECDEGHHEITLNDKQACQSQRATPAILISVFNPRRSEGYCSWICVSVKSHLTYGASVRPENAVTYSAGNEGQNICGVFSEAAPLQRSSTPFIVRPCVQLQSAIFPAESTHAHSRPALCFPVPDPGV